MLRIENTRGECMEVIARSGMHIGRGSKCHIRVKDGAVSRQHAVILEDTGLWIIRNLSQNGTRVDGRKTRVRSEDLVIEPGLRLVFGKVFVTFEPSVNLVREAPGSKPQQSEGMAESTQSHSNVGASCPPLAQTVMIDAFNIDSPIRAMHQDLGDDEVPTPVMPVAPKRIPSRAPTAVVDPAENSAGTVTKEQEPSPEATLLMEVPAVTVKELRSPSEIARATSAGETPANTESSDRVGYQVRKREPEVETEPRSKAGSLGGETSRADSSSATSSNATTPAPTPAASNPEQTLLIAPISRGASPRGSSVRESPSRESVPQETIPKVKLPSSPVAATPASLPKNTLGGALPSVVNAALPKESEEKPGTASFNPFLGAEEAVPISDSTAAALAPTVRQPVMEQPTHAYEEEGATQVIDPRFFNSQQAAGPGSVSSEASLESEAASDPYARWLSPPAVEEAPSAQTGARNKILIGVGVVTLVALIAMLWWYVRGA